MDSTRPKTMVIFAPEAGLGPHFNTMCVLGRTLQEMGHRVFVTHCPGVFARCPVMGMHQHPFDLRPEVKAHTCAECGNYSLRAMEAYGLEGLDLAACVTQEILEQVASVLAKAPSDLLTLEYDGIQFGRICALDLVLALKISDFSDVSAEHRLAWLKLIESSLTSYLLMDRLFTLMPVDTFLYFNDYSLMLGARVAADRHGIASHSITQAAHTNIDRRRYILLPTVGMLHFYDQRKVWPDWRDLALSPEQVTAVADDLIVRSGGSGSHVYSPAKVWGNDLYAALQLAPDKKLLVAFTSSLDEVLATHLSLEGMGLPTFMGDRPFTDQVEWLKALTEHVEAREDIQLVVRVHPREGKNKRESNTSQHLAKLKLHFERPFRNCRFVWPEDPISSYDLGEIADLALISWSTIGIELARMGVPLLATTPIISGFPVDDFLEWRETPEAYFQAIDELLERPAGHLPIARAFRYYHMRVLGNSVFMGDLVPTYDFTGLPVFQMPREADLLREVLVENRNVLDINLDRQRLIQGGEAAKLERQALEQQLRRFVHFCFTGKDLQGDFQLCLIDAEVREKDFDPFLLPPGAHLLFLDGTQVHYLTRAGHHRKRSSLVARIAPLCAQHKSQNLYEAFYHLVRSRDLAPLAKQAREMMAEGALEEARHLMVQALPRVSDGLELLNVLAEAEFGLGRADSALAILETLLLADPHNVSVLNNVSVILWANGQQQPALEHALKAFTLLPLHRDTVLNLGEMLCQLGRVDDASRVYAGFLGHHPDDPEVWAKQQDLLVPAGLPGDIRSEASN